MDTCGIVPRVELVTRAAADIPMLNLMQKRHLHKHIVLQRHVHAKSPSLVHINIFGCHRVSHAAKEKIVSNLSHMCRS
jgi:hypothetical protein